MPDDRRFRRNATLLFVGQWVSLMGDAVFLGAIAWLTKSLTGRDDAVGAVLFASTLPWLLFGPLAGAWVDRTDRVRAMIASDLARAFILLGLCVAARAGGLSVPLLAGAAFLIAAASTPFVPARDAVLPRLAEGFPFVRVNAAFQVAAQLAGLLGLWLGGWLLGTSPTGGALERDRIFLVLAIDAGTFVVSAVTLAFLRLPADPRKATRGPESSVFADARRGVAACLRDPLLLGLLVLTALNNLAIMGPAIVGAAAYIRDDLGLFARHFAWFEGVMASGYLVGALVLTRWGARAHKGRLILFGMVLDGLTYLPFFWVRSYPIALALIFVHGLFIPWIVVGRTALLQQHVPDERRGQVFSLVSLTVQGMTALSALLAGWIAHAYGAPSLFLAAGILGTLCGVAGFLIPVLRRAR